MDRGTETGIMDTIHSYLHKDHDIDVLPEDTVLYGPSTSNQIERWWKELHERLEKYFKQYLIQLKEEGHYDPCNEKDRSLLAFLMIPVLQRELNTFKDEVWNTHRIRQQKNTILPAGVPNHIYSFPERYELQDCGWNVINEQLEEVAELSGVMDVDDDFISIELREKCEQFIPREEEIKPCECFDAYIFLKKNIQ